MKKYCFTVDALVRDKKTAFLKDHNIEYVLRQLSHAEYLTYLKKKLQEEAAEAAELIKTKDVISELIDVYDVLYLLLQELRIDHEEFYRLREEKHERSGTYEGKLCLSQVTLGENNPLLATYKAHPEKYVLFSCEE